MLPRDSGEAHRASTPLELLFDLCFVVAVAQVSNELHHYLARGDAATALPSYVAVFFAIWWAG
jgi:low temperature requirement protein LtrA